MPDPQAQEAEGWGLVREVVGEGDAKHGCGRGGGDREVEQRGVLGLGGMEGGREGGKRGREGRRKGGDGPVGKADRRFVV